MKFNSFLKKNFFVFNELNYCILSKEQKNPNN